MGNYDGFGTYKFGGSGGGGGTSAGTSNQHQITDNSGGFLASILQETGGQIGAGGVTVSAVFSLSSIVDRGFIMPSMTTVQQNAISTPATGLEIYNTDTDAPMYNHSVDGWIPTGRYAGNPSTGTGAKNGQVMGANLDGELIAVRLVGVGATIYPANSSGNYSNNSVNLGTSGQNFLYGYFNRTYVNQVWVGSGQNIISATNAGSVGGGMSFSSGASQNFLKIHGETSYKGVSIADTDIISSDRIEASAVLELQSTTRGFLTTRMTTAQQGAISTPATGLQIYNTDDDTPNYNHSVDGWIPVGRYALNGAVINGGSAPTNSNMITSATTSGELTYAPFRWATGGGAYFMCTNTSGALSSGAIQLGAGSTLRWGTAWLTVANFSQQAQFSTGYIKGITGVSQLVLGGTTEGSADAHVSFVNAIGKIGVAVRDDGASFNNSVNIDASAILDLTSTTRGFLPPRMTSVEMNAISSPATGLMIYDTTTNQWMGYDGTSWVIIG